jgi:hypothetical protein
LEYIITRRLNQDILENFFSHVRAMGGANDNPNPIDFMHRLKWYILGRNIWQDILHTGTSPNIQILVFQQLKSIVIHVRKQDLSGPR